MADALEALETASLAMIDLAAAKAELEAVNVRLATELAEAKAELEAAKAKPKK